MADHPPAALSFVRTAAAAPALPGAYLLLIALPAPLGVSLAHRPATTLPPGRYLYAGSAYGPGGLRARLARHLPTSLLPPDSRQSGPKPHWHIDRLTAAGAAAGAWISPDGRECALVAALAHLPVPLPGFGSTDCRRCASHLLAWPPGAPLPFGQPPASPTLHYGRYGRPSPTAVCGDRPAASSDAPPTTSTPSG